MVDSHICHCVGSYPAGTQLFTAPPTGHGQRRVMGPTRWGVIMVLIGKPAVAGVRIPWSPWPPTKPPTIANAPAEEVDPEEIAKHVLNDLIYLTNEQQQDILKLLGAYPDRFATGATTGRTNMVTHRNDTSTALPIKQRPHKQSLEAH